MDLPKPPEDQELRTIIDKLANFVARNGPEFEQMTKIKQKDNAKFSFLFGGEHFNYYQYKVTTEQAILKQQKQKMEQQQAIVQQAISHQAIQTPPPWQQVQQIQQQQQQIQEQIRQSEQNLAAQHQVLMQQQQIQIDDAVKQAQDEKLKNLAADCDISLIELDKIVQPIIDSCTKDSISAGKGWIFVHSSTLKHADVIAKYLLKRIISAGTNFDLKLHLIYLVNDVLHHCVRKNAEDLKKKLETVVVPMFCSACVGVDEDKRQKLTKLLKLWESNSYFETSVIEQLKNPSISLTSYQANLLSDHASVISPISAAIQTQYSQLQKQHQDFVNHLTQVPPAVAQQDQKIQQQLQQQQPLQSQALQQQQQQQPLQKQALQQQQQQQTLQQQPLQQQPLQQPPLQQQSLKQQATSNLAGVGGGDVGGQVGTEVGVVSSSATEDQFSCAISSIISLLQSETGPQPQQSMNNVQNPALPGVSIPPTSLPSTIQNSTQNIVPPVAGQLGPSVPSSGPNQMMFPPPNFAQPPPNFSHGPGPGQGPGGPGNIPPHNFNQPPPHFRQTPNFGPPQNMNQHSPNFQPQGPFRQDHGDDYQNMNIVRHLINSSSGQGPNQSGTGGPISLPDLSRPPPGFPGHHPPGPFGPMGGSGPHLNMPPQPQPQPLMPQFDPNDPLLMPTVPYFELPAGLMATLVKLEDTDYMPLNPEEMRLPPPQPPSERLLAAVEAFYTPPSHERPRNSEGWEQLGLYEFFKAKQTAKRRVEEQERERRRSRSPSASRSPSQSDGQSTSGSRSGSRSRSASPAPTPRRRTRRYSGPNHSRSKSRSPSQSRSASPPPTPIRRRQSLSRSPSPLPYKRSSRSRSPSPQPQSQSSYSHGYQNANIPNRRIDESNKGHQLLMKMGWGGSGLGATEQGIQDPISGGDVRDRQDQYKGIGVDLNDPFENFRKSKSQGFINRMKARDEAREDPPWKGSAGRGGFNVAATQRIAEEA